MCDATEGRAPRALVAPRLLAAAAATVAEAKRVLRDGPALAPRLLAAMASAMCHTQIGLPLCCFDAAFLGTPLAPAMPAGPHITGWGGKGVSGRQNSWGGSWQALT